MNVRKNWRVLILVATVILSLSLVLTKGISFGIDFSGGTELKMELEKSGEGIAELTTRILKERLNGLGLKSIQVLPEVDGKHITIKVSTTDPDDLKGVKNILNQQAFFEQFVDGQLCARGDEIQLDVERTGGGSQISGSNWEVFVKTIGEAPARCGLAMKGKAGHMTDIFLDRPRDGAILLEETLCEELRGREFANNKGDKGYTQMEFIEKRANIPVVCFEKGAARTADAADTDIAEELGLEFEGNASGAGVAENATGNRTDSEAVSAVSKLRKLYSDGVRQVIVMDNATIPREILSVIKELNLSLKVTPKAPDQPFHEMRVENSWIDQVTGLKSTLEIQEGLTYGAPIYNSVFTGTAESHEAAQKIVEAYQIWLSSGNLPVKIRIVMEKPNLPEFGAQFLDYSMMIAIIAITLVAAVIAARYRKPKVSLGITIVGLSEVIIILGFASLVSWELDLAAVAGIIAAVGTGVDHQIIITDEALRGERKKGEKVLDLKNDVARAFFIIFTSAATTIGALLPLMSIVDLKGFAFTTIVGVLIGITITRPAYARIVEWLT